jgi:UDP-glucuronate decarboxylase
MSASWGNVNPIGPRACYDEGKRVAETLTYGFQRQDGVDVRVVRIFNTYGPRSMVTDFLCLRHLIYS